MAGCAGYPGRGPLRPRHVRRRQENQQRRSADQLPNPVFNLISPRQNRNRTDNLSSAEFPRDGGDGHCPPRNAAGNCNKSVYISLPWSEEIDDDPESNTRALDAARLG